MDALNSERLYKSYLNFIAIRNSMVYIKNGTYRRNDDNFLKVIGFPYIGEISKERKSFIGTKMDLMVQSINELIILGSKNTHRNLFLNSLLTL